MEHEHDDLMEDCIKYASFQNRRITVADLQKKFKIGLMRATRIFSFIESEYKKGGIVIKNKSRKKESKLVLIKVPSGSICIPPHRIQKIFKLVFNAGMKCQEAHPDDNSYDGIHFSDALKKVYKSLPRIGKI